MRGHYSMLFSASQRGGMWKVKAEDGLTTVARRDRESPSRSGHAAFLEHVQKFRSFSLREGSPPFVLLQAPNQTTLRFDRCKSLVLRCWIWSFVKIVLFRSILSVRKMGFKGS